MEIQVKLERAIHKLVDEFLTEPYRFFTEAEAVSRFHQMLSADAQLNNKVKSKDNYPIPLVHQGYPTFFRSEDAPLYARLDTPTGARRGQYDIVLLSPDFVRNHSAETVKNRNVEKERIKHIQPFQAVVEFRLEDRGWNSAGSKGAVAEMGKLILSRDEADLRYFVGLMRYSAPTENRWNKYWPEITLAAMDRMDIRSVFATYRMVTVPSAHVQSFGDWLSKHEEQQKTASRAR